AVARAEVDAASVRVADELDLRVAGGLQVALDVHGAVLEHRLRGCARRLVEPRQILLLRDDAHAAPAAAGDGLDDHGVADLAGDVVRLVDRVHRLDRPRQEGQAGLLHQLARSRLVADLLHHVRTRPDERDALVRADLGEVRILREEAVPGMDRVGARLQRRADQARDVQVAAPDRGRADLNGLVGEADDGGLGVGRRVDSDALDAELAAGARNAGPDL